MCKKNFDSPKSNSPVHLVIKKSHPYFDNKSLITIFGGNIFIEWIYYINIRCLTITDCMIKYTQNSVKNAINIYSLRIVYVYICACACVFKHVEINYADDKAMQEKAWLHGLATSSLNMLTYFFIRIISPSLISPTNESRK